MKTKILYQMAIVIASMGILYACKKSNSTDPGTSTTDVQTQSADESLVSTETDATTNDVNTTMSDQSNVSGAMSSPGYSHGISVEGAYPVKSLICDASVTVDTTSATKTITITYNGSNNCLSSRTRTGVVTISIPAGVQWKTAGAVITVNIQNLKITRLSDNKSITLNGTHTYTNVSGGTLQNLPNEDSVVHTITGSMAITFDNGAQRTWNIARQRVYKYSNGVTVTITGTHTDGTTSGIVEWGTNRFGNSFETVISTPIVISQECSLRVTGGVISTIRPEVTTTVTFGLDSTGTPTGCPGSGTYYFKAVWQGAGGKTYTVILPY